MNDRPPPQGHTPGPPPPGWYPDPWRQAPHRWWDGTGWTDRLGGQQPPRRESRLGLGAKIVLWSTAGIVGFFVLILAVGAVLDSGSSSPSTRTTPRHDDTTAAAQNQACRTQFAAAAREAINNPETDTQLRETVRACPDYRTWVAELRRQPAAFGLTERAVIEGPMEVANACWRNDGPVCDDARARGVITEDGGWNDS